MNETKKELVFDGMGVMYMLAVLVMVAVIVAMGVDFVSGWRKATLRGDEKTSYAASRTLTKFLIYEGILLIGVCIDTMIHFVWAMLMDGSYFVPLMTIAWGIILCIVAIKQNGEAKKFFTNSEEMKNILAQIREMPDGLPFETTIKTESFGKGRTKYVFT